MEGTSVDSKINKKQIGAPDEAWVLGDGSQIPCIYFFHQAKAYKSRTRGKIKECEEF